MGFNAFRQKMWTKVEIMRKEMDIFTKLWKYTCIPVAGIGLFARSMELEAMKQKQEKNEEEDTIILLSEEEKDKQAVISYFNSFDILKDDSLLVKRSKLYFGKYRVTLKSKDGLGLLDSPKPSQNTTFLICHPKKQEIIGEYKKWLGDIEEQLPTYPQTCQVVLIDSNCGCIGYHMFKTPPEIKRICNGPPIMVRYDGKIFGYTLFFMKSPKRLWYKLGRDFIVNLPWTLKDMQTRPIPIACCLFFLFILPYIQIAATLLGFLYLAHTE